MKKIAFIIFVIMLSVCHSQENNQSNRLEYKSFSFAPLGIYSDFETGGLAFNVDASFLYNEHIFTVSGTVGAEFTIIGDGDSFEQLNLLYGRELMFGTIIFIDAHLGLGYFSFKGSKRNSERIIKMGLPLGCKLRFKTGKRFSIGLQFQANINSVNSIYTSGILLQWNKR